MSTAYRTTLVRSRSLPRPDKKSRKWTVAFFLTLMALVSRGVFEVVVGKNAGYALQLVAVVFFTVLLLAFGKPRIRSGRGWSAFVAYGFVLVALLSVCASLLLERIDYFWFYLFVTLFYVAMLALYTTIDFGVSRQIAVGPVVAVVGVLLVVVALAQQFAHLSILPGSDLGTFGSFLRPSSLTGSFLHYPISAALMMFMLFGIASQTAKKRYGVAAAFLALGIVASLSRSGIVIMAVGLIVVLLRSPSIGGRLRIVVVLLLGAVVAAVAFPSGQFFDRVSSIFDANGAGNATRIDIWTSILQLWSESPLLIGSHAGQYTNVTSNLAGVDGGIAESGVLQMLISWGALGLICFYTLLAGTASTLPRLSPWFLAGAIAGMVQSLVYQSIEVLPFMVIFAWFPFIASGNEPPMPPPVGGRSRIGEIYRQRQMAQVPPQ